MPLMICEHSYQLKEIAAERERQDEKFGIQNHPDQVWNSILVEEIGEISRALNEINFSQDHAALELWKANLRSELIQVSAVAVAWIEAIDRKGKKCKP